MRKNRGWCFQESWGSADPAAPPLETRSRLVQHWENQLAAGMGDEQGCWDGEALGQQRTWQPPSPSKRKAFYNHANIAMVRKKYLIRIRGRITN